MSIQSKTIIAGVAIFALAGGITGIGMWSVNDLVSNGNKVNSAAEILRNHMQADMMHDALRADVLAAILVSDPASGLSFNAVKKDLTEHEASFREVIENNKALATDPTVRRVLGDVEAPLATYIDSASNMVGLAESDHLQALKELPEFMSQFSHLEEAMEKAGDKIQAVSEAVAGQGKAIQQQVSILLMALFAAAAAFSVGLYLLARRSITSPILALSKAMQQLADGDTDINCPGRGRRDEIGIMAEAVEVFRLAAIANKQLEQRAEDQRLQGEKDRLAAQQAAEADATERLKSATSGLAGGLQRLATGDLAFQLEIPFSAEFEELRHDFNTSVKQLSETLSAVSAGIQLIDEGTRDISSSVGDLAKRTERQAAALEETAAALEQITVNVGNSSKRTEEASSVATQANRSATTSLDVVSKAEEAMGRIEASAQQISNIIGVIDEIAFQTNLLALNAGVEAARAGEAGKGFAVVAQEVRELAQRSARAAKEIKSLIGTSSGEVDSGVKLVRETGIALKSIGEQVVNINSHMASIATSAREQSTGLLEVNVAVNSMDQTTQQNAAMVEEATAAAAGLAEEAMKLRDLVGHFRLGRSQSVETARTQAA
jgi:methyl-accepting chemotaxis protein